MPIKLNQPSCPWYTHEWHECVTTVEIQEHNGAKLGGPALSYLGCSAFQMKGRFKGYDISRTIGISQDGMFLGRPEFHRMGRF